MASEKEEVPPDLKNAASVYQHPDPILRRLRLEDTGGNLINDLKTYFKHKKVLLFYFGSVYGEASLRPFHRDLVELCMREPKTFSLIYVSVDTEEKSMKSLLQGKPWCRMTFHDGSDFAPLATSAPQAAAMTELLRGEDFIPASDDYQLPPEGQPDDEEYYYTRPLSRAAFSQCIGALATPTLTVYHLPTHRVLNRFARKEMFSSSKARGYMAGWKEGRSGGVSARELISAIRLPIIIAILAISYRLAVYILGPEYDLLPDLMQSLTGGKIGQQLSAFAQQGQEQISGAFGKVVTAGGLGGGDDSGMKASS